MNKYDSNKTQAETVTDLISLIKWLSFPLDKNKTYDEPTTVMMNDSIHPPIFASLPSPITIPNNAINSTVDPRLIRILSINDFIAINILNKTMEYSSLS